jgi:hypothetical protein
MSSNNNEIQKNENSNKQENKLNRTDSSNINDIETNKILEKEDHINESTNLKVDRNIQKEKNNVDFFHDKDITEDSIIYFSKKLKHYNENYKFILYISILLYIIDIFIWLKSQTNLHSFTNLLSIIIIMISSIHQAFSYRHNFESISKELYIFTKKIIYIFIAVYLIYMVNILYILISKMLEIIKINEVIVDNSFEKIIIMIYSFFNMFIPSLNLIRLINIKKGIKDLSSSKGEIYERSKIEDIDAIQSVINEI